jgi:hypothetical protein
MERLENIKNIIEGMNKHHQIEILKILNKTDSKINENKSGVYVNMSFLDENTVLELEKYISYTKDQENCLIPLEYQKEEFKNAYFIEKEDKDNLTISYNDK